MNLAILCTCALLGAFLMFSAGFKTTCSPEAGTFGVGHNPVVAPDCWARHLWGPSLKLTIFGEMSLEVGKPETELSKASRKSRTKVSSVS